MCVIEELRGGQGKGGESSIGDVREHGARPEEGRRRDPSRYVHLTVSVPTCRTNCASAWTSSKLEGGLVKRFQIRESETARSLKNEYYCTLYYTH